MDFEIYTCPKVWKGKINPKMTVIIIKQIYVHFRVVGEINFDGLNLFVRNISRSKKAIRHIKPKSAYVLKTHNIVPE